MLQTDDAGIATSLFTVTTSLDSNSARRVTMSTDDFTSCNLEEGLNDPSVEQVEENVDSESHVSDNLHSQNDIASSDGTISSISPLVTSSPLPPGDNNESTISILKSRCQRKEPTKKRSANSEIKDYVQSNFIFDAAVSNVPSTCNIGETTAQPQHQHHCKKQSYHQPTSKSSLASARAFFQHLDSNHHLTILNNNKNSSQSNKTNVIRTKRRLVHCNRNPKLQAEYWKYCETLEYVGVDPISIREFAKNWNLHFTEKRVICDGLLDEYL